MTRHFKGMLLVLVFTAALASGCKETSTGFEQYLQQENAAIKKFVEKPSGINRYPGNVAPVVNKYLKQQKKDKRAAPPYRDRQESEIFDSEYLKELEK